MMSEKTKRIIWIIFMIIPCLILVMSGVMKILGAEQIVTGLTKAGFGGLITSLGVLELIIAALFIYPRTYKVGFLLACGYFGGAMAIEIAGGQIPNAALFLTLAWISVFMRDRTMFLSNSK